MTDEKGTLPGNPATPGESDRGLRSDSGTLPRAGVIEEIPIPLASITPVVELAAERSISEGRSLEEALAAATAAGMLDRLPEDFGDASGHWTIVRSTNPFTVLYLDYRLAAQITPQQVTRHRELLQKFWQDKLRSMSQGAARFAILRKYGGSDESERLVRSYPDLIERAYEQLATRNGIDEAYRKIVYDVRSAVLKQVDAKLDDFLLDGVLHPQEIQALLRLAHAGPVPRSVVASRIEERLRARAMAPVASPEGATLEERLLSTTWKFADSEGGDYQAQRVPAKSPLIPLLLFSTVVIVVLLISAALIGSRSDTVQESDVPAPLDRVVPETSSVDVVRLPAPPAEGTGVEPSRRERPADRPQPVDAGAADEKEKRRREKQIREVRTELEEIEQSADADPTTALARLDDLDARLQRNSQQFMSERLDLANLRSHVQKVAMDRTLAEERERVERESREKREREWEQRIGQIETFMRERNYSGAKKLANELLAEPELPEPVAERARGLSAQAIAELQKVFSGAKVTSRTGRTPRGQKP